MQIDRAILTIISINVLSCYLKPDVVTVSATYRQQGSTLAVYGTGEVYEAVCGEALNKSTFTLPYLT